MSDEATAETEGATETDAVETPLALTDLFRYPTVRTLAAHVASSSDGPAADEPERTAGAARGERRRRAMSKRGR